MLALSWVGEELLTARGVAIATTAIAIAASPIYARWSRSDGAEAPRIEMRSSVARLCFNTEPQELIERLQGPPGHPPLLNQQDANGWTALMWCAHWCVVSRDRTFASFARAGVKVLCRAAAGVRTSTSPPC